jgi:hypothetical protein
VRNLFQWIEAYYNRKRIQKKLGYRSPSGYEENLTDRMIKEHNQVSAKAVVLHRRRANVSPGWLPLAQRREVRMTSSFGPAVLV